MPSIWQFRPASAVEEHAASSLPNLLRNRLLQNSLHTGIRCLAVLVKCDESRIDLADAEPIDVVHRVRRQRILPAVLNQSQREVGVATVHLLIDMHRIDSCVQNCAVRIYGLFSHFYHSFPSAE